MSSTSPTLPTYTLPLVEGLISPSRPPKLVPAVIAVSIAMFVAVTITGGICLNGNMKRGVVWRADAEDDETLDIEEEESIIMSERNDQETATTQNTNISQTQIRPPAPASHTSSSTESTSSTSVQRTHHNNIDPSTRAEVFNNDSVNHLQSSRRNSAVPSLQADSYVPEHASENSRNLGYGSFGSDAPSRLQLGSEFEGSVTFSRIQDWRIEGDPY